MLSTTQYYFYAGSNFIDFSMYPDFDPKRLMAVINTTVGQTLIYATGGSSGSPTGGSFSGSTGNYQLYLNYNTSSAGMSDYDILQIIYDESVGVEEAKSSVDIVSGKAGLDINVLSSSFGGTVGDVMPAPFQDNALSIGVLNGGVLESPAMNVNNELIVDVTQSGPVPISMSGSVNVYGTVSVDNFPATQAVTGTFWPGTQPVSATSLPLPTGASTSSLQTTGNSSLSSIDGKFTTLNGSVSTSALQTTGNAVLTSIDSKATSIDNKFPTQGQKASSGSLPIVIASDQSSIPVTQTEIYITGQATLTAGNNIFLSTAGAGSTDTLGYKTGSVQIVSAATSGTFFFEQSNDNINFQPIAVFRSDSASPNAIVTAITPSASSFFYHFPIKSRYIRCRITTVLNTTVQSFLRLSQESWSPIVPNITNATAANLNATVAGALTSVGTITTVTGVTTVSGVTSANLSAATATDISLASFTTTATSANISMANIQAASFLMNVTAITGTNVTLDITIQETYDGANFFDVYHFPRITAAGQYITPSLKLSGIGIRYVRTVSGTTPSITMSGIRISRSLSTGYIRSFINRAIDPNTLNSTTPSYLVEGSINVHLCVTMAAGGSSSPVFKLQGTEDQTNWYDLGAGTITAAPSTSSAINYNGLQPKYVRAITSTAGTGAVLTSLCIKSVGV